MIQRSFVLCLSATLLLAGAVFGGTQEVEKIYKAAEQEGEVVWVSTWTEKEAAPVTKAFDKEHPKIKARFERQHGGEAMERLVREVASGEIPYDAVMIHPDYMTEFLKMNVIEQVNWTDFGVPAEFVTDGNRFVGAVDDPFVIVYNKNLVKPEDSPKNWEDFLDPKWKGRFVIDTRPSGFLRLTGAWGPEKVLDYLRKLAANKPIFLRGQNQTATLMAAGDYQVAISMYLHNYVRIGEQKGGPLAFNIPNPLPTSWHKFCVFKKGMKHPNAGKVFLGWLGQKGAKMMEEINWGQAMPYKGSRKEKLYKGITLSYPPTQAQVPDRQKYTLEMLKALGVRK